MATLRFSPNLTMLYKESGGLINRFMSAKEAGFQAVEVCFPYFETKPSELKDIIKKTSLQNVLINSYPGDLKAGDLGFAAIPDRIEEFKESLKLSIEYANALKCSRIHIMCGKCSEKYSRQEMQETLINNLKYASDILRQDNIVGLLEPLNPYTGPNYFLNCFELALDVLKAVDRDNIKLQLDIFHLQVLHGNLKRNIEKYLPFAGHIQIAQPPNRIEMDGPGEIQYQYILKVLEELGYQGYIGLEYVPSGTTTDGLAWLNKWGYM